MTSTLLIQLIITCFLGAASPGPSLVLVSKNAILNGKFSGSLTGFGHGIGIFIYAFLSIISIGVINDINTLLIDIITIVLVQNFQMMIDESQQNIVLIQHPDSPN